MTKKTETELQWGRGFDTAETIRTGAISTSRRRFNGAAVLIPRKLEATQETVERPLRLQWGRGFDTAETEIKLIFSPEAQALQWGRGFDTAETVTV